MYLPPDEEQDLTPVLTKQQEFKYWFDYNPETGALHKIRYGKYHTPCFKPANLFLKRNVLWTNIKNVSCPVKHLIWCYMTGYYPEKHECIAGDSLKFKDLKLTTYSALEHQIKPFTLRFGAQRTSSGKYLAAICVNGKRRHLGTFDTEQEARIAYMKRKIEVRSNTYG